MKRIKWSEFYLSTGKHIQNLFEVIKNVDNDLREADGQFRANRARRKYKLLKESVGKDRLLDVSLTMRYHVPTMDEMQVANLHKDMGKNNFPGVLSMIIEYEEFVSNIAGPEKIPLRPAALEVVIKDQNDVMFYP